MEKIDSGMNSRVALLVDCDNTTPEILEYALRVVAQFGRVVLRRGYGNHATLANKWQEALVRLAFTPCLQYQYAAGKNTADIALALDAVEALFDQRADTFCLVTSDSDFAYLCRKLRERGATVHIVGEAKTPDALRNASDQFFEWLPPEPPAEPLGSAAAAKAPPAPAPKPAPKKRPKAVLNAVSLLAADTPDGRVGLGALGQYLKRTDPGFSPKAYGHTALSDMVRAYPDLAVQLENGSTYWVSLKPKPSAVG
nr:NYN domain-containing protein [uncultured Roseateles sp.]